MRPKYIMEQKNLRIEGIFSKYVLVETYLFSSICCKPCFSELSSHLKVQERVLVLPGKISQNMMFLKQKFLIFIRNYFTK